MHEANLEAEAKEAPQGKVEEAGLSTLKASEGDGEEFEEVLIEEEMEEEELDDDEDVDLPSGPNLADPQNGADGPRGAIPHEKPVDGPPAPVPQGNERVEKSDGVARFQVSDDIDVPEEEEEQKNKGTYQDIGVAQQTFSV